MLKTFIFSLLSLLIFSLPCYSDNPLQEIKIYTAKLPPWIEGVGDKCIAGPICDILNKMEVDTKLNISFSSTSVGRANNFFFKGRQGLALFGYDTAFEKKYHSIKKIFKYETGYVVSGNKTKQEALQGKVCTTSLNPHKLSGVDYYEVAELNQCLKMYKEKRIVSIFLTDVEWSLLRYEANTVGLKNMKFHTDMSKYLTLFLNKKFKKDSHIFKKVKRAAEKIDMVVFEL